MTKKNHCDADAILSLRLHSWNPRHGIILDWLETLEKTPAGRKRYGQHLEKAIIEYIERLKYGGGGGHIGRPRAPRRLPASERKASRWSGAPDEPRGQSSKNDRASPGIELPPTSSKDVHSAADHAEDAPMKKKLKPTPEEYKSALEGMTFE